MAQSESEASQLAAMVPARFERPRRTSWPRSGLPSPSDGGLEVFFEFCFTRAVRSATCCRSCPICSRSSLISATCSWSSAISASRSVISSRSRAFAARSPATVSARTAAWPGTGGVSGTSRTPSQSALS